MRPEKHKKRSESGKRLSRKITESNARAFQNGGEMFANEQGKSRKHLPSPPRHRFFINEAAEVGQQNLTVSLRQLTVRNANPSADYTNTTQQLLNRYFWGGKYGVHRAVGRVVRVRRVASYSGGLGRILFSLHGWMPDGCRGWHADGSAGSLGFFLAESSNNLMPGSSSVTSQLKKPSWIIHATFPTSPSYVMPQSQNNNTFTSSNNNSSNNRSNTGNNANNSSNNNKKKADVGPNCVRSHSSTAESHPQPKRK